MTKWFVIKSVKSDPPIIECTWHLEAEDKEAATTAFNALMPGYEISKVKCRKDGGEGLTDGASSLTLTEQ